MNANRRLLLGVLGAISAAGLLAGLLVWLSGSSSVGPLETRYLDVETGVWFVAPSDRYTSVPARNERDGDRTVFPAHRDESGLLQIDRRYEPAIRALHEEGRSLVSPDELVYDPD